MGLCVGMIRGGRANGTPRIPFTMGNGLVPGPGPSRALVSGPLTDKGASDSTRDWACDVTDQVAFPRSRAGKGSRYEGRFVTASPLYDPVAPATHEQ